MLPTLNDIPLDKRKLLVNKLNQLLCNAIDLHLQAKQAHWNVKGENFIALHELFDKIAIAAAEATDMIAERIKQLGGQAIGTADVVAKQSSLKEYPVQAVDSAAHVQALASAIAGFNTPAREAIDDTAGLSDAVTADMLTEITRGLDQQLWFVESHLSADASDIKRLKAAQ